MTKMRTTEAFRYQSKAAGVAVVFSIDDDRDDELSALDSAAARAGQGPFFSKETLVASLGARGNQRQKQVATVNRVLDFLIPVVARLEIALVEPSHVGSELLQVGEQL